MKHLLILTFIGSLFFVLGCKLEDGWMGIKVFETSRDEVEKLLGKPTEEEIGLTRYETDQALFSFYFADGPCSKPETLLGGFRVPKGTVLQYSVTPKKALRIEQLKWDKQLYDRTESSHQLGIISYRNRRDAIDIETNKFNDERGEVVRTIYFQRSPEQMLRYNCKK